MTKNRFSQLLGRLVTAIIILGITVFFTPSFTNSSLWIVVLAVLCLAIGDFVITTFSGLFSSPIVKGIIGFVLCTITLYFVQYIITGYTLSWIAAILRCFSLCYC